MPAAGQYRAAAPAAPSSASRVLPRRPEAATAWRRRRDCSAGAGESGDGVPDRTIEIKLMLAASSGRLDLSDCGLLSVPEAVFELEDLEELSLAGNQLREVPAAIGRLQRLRRLQLSGNGLRAVPAELGWLPQLEGLWLHGNRLEELPPSLGDLAALTQLQLSGNALRALPPELGGLRALRDLGAAGNRLAAFPRELSGCSALEKLALFGNRLGELPGGAVEGLVALRELWLQGNALRALPDGALATLPVLQHLSAADCALEAAPAALAAAPALRTLSLYGNALRDVPPQLLRAPQLEQLWLEGNPLGEQSVTALLRVLRDLHAARASAQGGADNDAGGPRFKGLGLDDSQLAAAAEADVQAAAALLRAGQLAPGSGRGYFKLERPAADSPAAGGTGAAAAARALVVAFGSAPGVPNWGGLLRRVRDAAASPAEACFDVLYVVDPGRSWYSGGTAEGVGYWRERLEGVAGRYGSVLLLGDSMGATAALLLAPAATAVLAFCPQVDLGTSSIRPGEEDAWFAALRHRVVRSVEAAAAGGTQVTVHVGNWQHDLDQARLLPAAAARLCVYSVDSHRLAAALDARRELLPLVRSTLLGQMGLPGGRVRLANLL